VWLKPETKKIGRRAGAAAVLALAIKVLKVGVNPKDYGPFAVLAGTQNTAVVIGAGAVLMAVYFLIQATSEWLVEELKGMIDSSGESSSPVRMPKGEAKRVQLNLAAQSVTGFLLIFLDLWGPVILAVFTTIILWPDALRLINSYYHK
jgi:hypothetical protein